MRVRTLGDWKEVSGGRVRVGSAWRRLRRIRAYVNGAWEDVATFTPPLSLALSTETINDFTFTVPTFYASDVVIATPTGGAGPFTYAWTRTSGDASFVIDNPTGSFTQFTRNIAAEGVYSATFQCVVTDSESSTASASVNVTVNAINV